MKTLLFSNINGNILDKTSLTDCSFTKTQTMVLKKNIESGKQNLIFINAEGLANDKNYYKTILNCFREIGISFNKSLELNLSINEKLLKNFSLENRVYFLMGGNPFNQIKIIKKCDLEDILKLTNDFVIGFCAGAINLSENAIITSDDDFTAPATYKGIGRITLNIEPHFKMDKSSFTKNRILELIKFCKTLNIEITALCDKSCIFIDNEKTTVYGKTYIFKNEI